MVTLKQMVVRSLAIHHHILRCAAEHRPVFSTHKPSLGDIRGASRATSTLTKWGAIRSVEVTDDHGAPVFVGGLKSYRTELTDTGSALLEALHARSSKAVSP